MIAALLRSQHEDCCRAHQGHRSPFRDVLSSSMSCAMSRVELQACATGSFLKNPRSLRKGRSEACPSARPVNEHSRYYRRFHEDAALTFGRAIASTFSQAKGQSLGILPRDRHDLEVRRLAHIVWAVVSTIGRSNSASVVIRTYSSRREYSTSTDAHRPAARSCQWQRARSSKQLLRVAICT